MSIASDYYYDKDAQYKLTAAQLADGWTVEFTKNSVTYNHDGSWGNPTTDTPGFRSWYKNGRLKREFHYQNKLYHNPNPSTPACLYWHQNGQLHMEFNYSKGLIQDPAPNAPANKVWHANGQLSNKSHYQNGLLQNPNSSTPASLCLDENANTLFAYDYCNGVKVPTEFWQWTIKDALNTDNLEQRRVWFETNGGWEAFESEFKLLDEQPDPANDGFTLRLCIFPNHLNVYDNQARIIFCNNASLDLDGSRRRYALVVPVGWGNDALSVMARSFGLTSDEYSMLKVAK